MNPTTIQETLTESIERIKATHPEAIGNNTPTVSPGDHVQDKDTGDALIVIGKPGFTAREFVFSGSTTVAEVNKDYSPTDEVVMCVYPSEGDLRDAKPYAFPVGRLTVTHSLTTTDTVSNRATEEVSDTEPQDTPTPTPTTPEDLGSFSKAQGFPQHVATDGGQDTTDAT